MEETIKCGKHLAQNANLSESEFHNVNLCKAKFDNVNLSGAGFHNINFSDVSFTAAQMGGTKFQHIGLPPEGPKGRQRPLIFDECDLNSSSLTKCNLSNVKIQNCQIDGIQVKGLLEKYKNQK
ncbi:MAG: pentapeptide repeat-containing protein [Sedimentisphaerales bacterium]